MFRNLVVRGFKVGGGFVFIVSVDFFYSLMRVFVMMYKGFLVSGLRRGFI